MNRTAIRSSLLLFLTALIWGVAFVAQSVGMDYVGPFTFNCIRSLIGAAVLVPCIRLLDGWKKKNGERPESFRGNSQLWLGGCLCGAALFVASNLQQIGIRYTSVGKAGFITALYIVLVPVLGIFLNKRPGAKLWISVLLAVAGMYRLCVAGEAFTIGRGEVLVLLCAFAFSVQILLVSRYSPVVDGIRLSCIEFLVSGLLSGVFMLLLEKPQLSSILQAWMPILYAGVFSCGIAYTLQVVAQKDLNPTLASLIMSLESVVSALAGWLILGQVLTAREITGCVLMFAAILLAQLPERRAAQGLQR